MTPIFLFILILSFLIHFVAMIPFIDFLYQIKFRRVVQQTKDMFDQKTPIFDKFHNQKAGTPVGGGILIVAMTSILYLLCIALFFAFKINPTSIFHNLWGEVGIILFTFISFAVLGFYDDIAKFYATKGTPKFHGLRWRHKLILELVLAVIIAIWLYFEFQIRLINIPFFGPITLSTSYLYFAVFVIVAFANAVNITDGLDGLSSGSLFIALLSFWAISATIVDTPLQLFICLWIGGILAFLYFNVFPARIWLGDTGALSFGATFAVIGLLLGKPLALVPIGGIFILEALSSMLQIISKKMFHKKLFSASPFHLLLQFHGWQESKIVARAWILSILFALFGLMIALYTK